MTGQFKVRRERPAGTDWLQVDEAIFIRTVGQENDARVFTDEGEAEVAARHLLGCSGLRDVVAVIPTVKCGHLKTEEVRL